MKMIIIHNDESRYQEWVDSFKKIIGEAFQIGQDYATERP